MTTLNMLILGEAGTGKSEMVKKFLDSGHQVQVTDSENFWDYQQGAKPLTREFEVNGQKLTLQLVEVQGSRGRSSNYFEIRTASHTADCVLFCFDPTRDWTMGSFDRTLKYVNTFRGEQPITKKKRGVFNRKGNKEEQKSKVSADLPVYLIQTMSDKVQTDAGEAFAKTRNLPFFSLSALKGENINETFETICKDMLQRQNEAEVKKPKEEKAKQEEQEAAKKKLETKTELGKILSKMMKLLGKAETQQSMAEAA